MIGEMYISVRKGRKCGETSLVVCQLTHGVKN